MTIFGHFLDNIRLPQVKPNLLGHKVQIPLKVKKDLQLTNLFLARAAKGISMNILMFKKSTVVQVVDKSRHGLGGRVSHRKAWAYVILDYLQNRAHINILEFLAKLVGIWIEIIKKNARLFLNQREKYVKNEVVMKYQRKRKRQIKRRNDNKNINWKTVRRNISGGRSNTL